MTTDSYHTTFAVPTGHPCLPGHFPGHPLVPGVLLLEQVAAALRQWRGERLSRVREAKFIAPLGPGQLARLNLTQAGAQVRFEIRHDGALLARGLVEGAARA